MPAETLRLACYLFEYFLIIFYLHSQRFTDRRRAFLLAVDIEMRVNVCRGLNIGMSEPFPDHLHRHFFRQQQRRAGVPELVEADMPESVFLQQKSEVLRNIVRSVQSPEGVRTDIFLIIRTVAFPEKEIAAILKQKGNVKPESSDPKRSSLPKSLETIRSSRLFFCFATVKKRFRNANGRSNMDQCAICLE